MFGSRLKALRLTGTRRCFITSLLVIEGVSVSTCGGKTSPVKLDNDVTVRVESARPVTSLARASPVSASDESVFSYVGYSPKERSWLDSNELLKRLSRTTVVCFGENDGQTIDKAAEITILSALARRSMVSGRKPVIALEAFDSINQSVLSAYSTGKSKLSDVLAKANKELSNRERELLASLLQRAKIERSELWAVGASHEQVERVEKKTFDGPREEERRQFRTFETDEQYRGQPISTIGELSSNDLRQVDFRNFDVNQLTERSVVSTLSFHFAETHSSYQVLVIADKTRCRPKAIPAQLRNSVPVSIVSICADVSRDDGMPPQSDGESDLVMVFSSMKCSE